MSDYWKIAGDAFTGYGRYVWKTLTQPGWDNYLYWLIGVSLLFWVLEILIPWRKKQAVIRRDFWLDGFYMFFNFFLFSLIGYHALSTVFAQMFNDGLAWFGVRNLVFLEIQTWPAWAKLLAFFLIRDVIHFHVHMLLHRVPFLWQFHKVHHSVQEMGFAAHLRYHWMENVVYRSIEYIPMAMIGFGLQEFFIVHIFALSIGHFNHSNIRIPLGPLKYIFNNPQMHIWHHAKEFPEERRYGMNFGISLSIWDYLYGTAYIPESGRDIPLGFENVEEFPQDFVRQSIYPVGTKKDP